ncbi:MAG: hypothetical protein ACR2N2_11120 [Acidimicrobiia bacterium]
MDPTTRWETEAMRSAPSSKQSPPKPTGKKPRSKRSWVTLKEAEAATGIPSNTLRKWVRKETLASYLESDGDLAIRMVDLNDVERRAAELGRPTAPVVVDTQEHDDAAASPTTSSSSDPAWPASEEDVAAPVPDGTMLVPVDAWNKMLAQLGNLHEAGQQLADARERAGKAETEAAFLREQLAETRKSVDAIADDVSDPVQQVQADDTAEVHPGDDGGADARPDRVKPTTTYWRYVTTGWRARRRS